MIDKPPPRRVTWFKLATLHLSFWLYADQHADGYLWAHRLMRDSFATPGQLRELMTRVPKPSPAERGIFEAIDDAEHDASRS